MKPENMVSNHVFAENFATERDQREVEKYGRAPGHAATQFANPDQRHSIEPAYGNYDRPINESV